MRVAVILGGEPRFCEEFSYFIKNITECDSVDYFCYLWETSPEYCSVQGSHGHKLVSPIWQHITPSFVQEKFKQELPHNHHLVSASVNDSSLVSYSPITSNFARETVQGNVWKMWNSLYHANELKCIHEHKNNFKYDVVIRGRPDTAIMSPISMSKIKEKLDNNGNQVIIPQNTRCGYGVFISDMFGMSSSRVMDTYFNIYNEAITHHQQGALFHPETMLARHLEHHGIQYSPEEFMIEARYFGIWEDINTGDQWSCENRYNITNWENKRYTSLFGSWGQWKDPTMGSPTPSDDT